MIHLTRSLIRRWLSALLHIKDTPERTAAAFALGVFFGFSPFLGLHDGKGYALLYNGILGDRRPDGGNVLTRATLQIIREAVARKASSFDGPLTIYGEQSRLGPSTLARENVTFKQTPYDVKARR